MTDKAFPLLPPDARIEPYLVRLGAIYGRLVTDYNDSDDSNPADEALAERKLRAEGLLLEALVARFAMAEEIPFQLIRAGVDPEDDEMLLSALADQWQRARGAGTLAEWSTLLRAEIGDLLEELA